MSDYGISPLSGLPLTSQTMNENGFLKYFEGPTTWASNIKFDADPNDHVSPSKVATKPCLVGNLNCHSPSVTS